MGKIKNIDKIIADGTDEEVLTAFHKFLQRVSVSTEFLQDEDDLVYAEIFTATCGDKMFASEPYEFEWPLQYLPIPEAFKERLN